MFGKKKFYFQEEAGDNKGGSGGADDIQAKIDAAVAKEVAGLKAKNEELIGTNKKFKEQLKSFEGLDPEKIKATIAHFDNSEEAKLIAEGKIDDVIQKRIAKKEEAQAKLMQEKEAEIGKVKETLSKYNMRMLQGEIRASAPTDIHPSALADAIRHATEMFTLDEEGNVVPKDGKFGKDGNSPYSLKEWFEDDRQVSLHRYANQNSGSRDFNKGAKNEIGKTMSREKFDSLDGYEKAAVVKAGTKIVDR